MRACPGIYCPFMYARCESIRNNINYACTNSHWWTVFNDILYLDIAALSAALSYYNVISFYARVMPYYDYYVHNLVMFCFAKQLELCFKCAVRGLLFLAPSCDSRPFSVIPLLYLVFIPCVHHITYMETHSYYNCNFIFSMYRNYNVIYNDDMINQHGKLKLYLEVGI